MAIRGSNPNLLLEFGRGRSLDFSPIAQAFRLNRQQEREDRLLPIRERLLQSQAGQAEVEQRINQQREVIRNNAFLGANVSGMLESGDVSGAVSFLQRQKPFMNDANKAVIDGAIKRLQSGRTEDVDLIKQRAKQAVQVGQQFGQIQSSQEGGASSDFQRALNILNDPQATEVEKSAARRQVGIESRAGTKAPSQSIDIGGVPFVFNPNTSEFKGATADGKEITASSVAEARKKIKEAEAEGQAKGARRQKDIASINEQVKGIDRGANNIDRAVKAIDDGADTGRIESFFPSINAATIELQQILGDETLNRLSQVTLGAISESELSLLKETALPVNMQEEDLKAHLKRKKAALKKARKVALEQLRFLRKGGTVEEFILSKARGAQPQSNGSSQQSVGRFKIIEVQ